jgi:hypothetical protein
MTLSFISGQHESLIYDYTRSKLYLRHNLVLLGIRIIPRALISSFGSDLGIQIGRYGNIG